MKKLGDEAEVRQLAAGLKVDWRQNAVENIITLCHSKISNWLRGHPTVTSMAELEHLVCRKLKLVFEFVWSDEDLLEIIRRYVRLGEPVFATLKADLDEKTFATLIERRKITAVSQDRYIAVVDCRGSKCARRFFTRWHEIAHILTLQGQLELPLHRSTRDKNPTERLMDTIAGEIGFYEPLFRPILNEEVAKEGFLTFAAVERIRTKFCPEASFHATLNACVNRLGTPALVMEAGLGLKKHEEEQVNSPQQELLPVVAPKPKLRVKHVTGNKWAAAAELRMHQNIQVPSSSVIHRLFFSDGSPISSDAEAVEWLGAWRHSDGKSPSEIRVKMQARRLPESVLALLLPAR